MTTIVILLLSLSSWSPTVLGEIGIGLPPPSPPSMKKQPPHEQLFQVSLGTDEAEKPFMLECEAEGNPEPKYRWIKNGLEFDYVAYDKRISQQPRRGTLVFTKPDSVDEGLYQCFAENIHGTSVSNAVFLRKSELNSFPDQDMPLQLTVNDGDPQTIDCNPPTGYPKPAIFWVIQSNTGALRSINSSRLTVDPEGRLHFSNVTKEDVMEDGLYACAATSFFRTEYKIGKKVQLRVDSSASSGTLQHPPIKHYLSPPSVPALRGQKLDLHCIFGGTPLPEIAWRKRGGTIEGSRYTFINFGKTLQIQRVDFQDEGTYECTASNGVGSQQSHAMSVVVQAAPYWYKVPNNTNAAEDESVTFECQARGVPDPKLQWLVNGVPIDRAKSNPRRKVEGNTLILRHLEKSDTAVYQCNASNVHGYAFQDFYINVLSLPPQIVVPPDPITRAVVTSTVILKCRVFGAPKPTVRWYKNGVELTGGRYEILPEGDLKISDIIVTDQGEYTCHAANKFDEKRVHGELQVKMKTRITHPPENVEVAAGKLAVFRCIADSDPSLNLKIEWHFNNKQLDFEQLQRIQQATDNSLSIGSAIELDSGVYTCVARTELDSASAKATLIVQDVPNHPKIVGVDCEGSSAMVEWMPTGDRRAPILSYSIQYNTSFTPDVWEDAFVNIPAPDNRFRVSMSPWANYTFRVVARNKIGPSLPSEPSATCTTEEDVPHKNPEKVQGRGSTPTNLEITWAPMPLIEQNAPGFFYKIFWKRNDIPGAKWQTRVIDDWQRNRLVIEGQETFKPYRIKVEAHNRRGQAHMVATEVLGFSGEDRPSLPPRNFRHLQTLDARTAVFSWDPVPPNSLNGHFKGYKIQAWTESNEVDDDESRREMIVPPNVTQAVASIFKPFSKNYAVVFAFNEMYNGPSSERIEIATPEGVPGPVAMFKAIPMGSSSFYLKWDRPLEMNGIPRGYRIYYEEVHGTQLGPKLEKSPRITDPNAVRTKLVGLKPGSKYRITIHAMTNRGEGEGYFIEESTRVDDDAVPDKPSLQWLRLPDEEGKSGIRVTWIPNIENNRPGSHFYVQYRRRGETQLESTPMEEENDFIIVRGLEPTATYEVRVVSVDGKHQTPSEFWEVNAGALGIHALTDATGHLVKADWFVGMLSALALILILAVLVCVVQRNRGGKYAVHEKEIAQGRGLEYDHDGFDEYPSKPLRTGRDSGDFRRSHLSPDSSIRGGPDDDDVLIDYEGDETSHFGEDGSFIGQYVTKRKADRERDRLERERLEREAAAMVHRPGTATFV